jgi:hypothetical protein
MHLPDWIQKFKEPRTEIKRIKNGFYTEITKMLK